MSDAGWKLRRLRAMGAAEVWQRASVAVRDRLAPRAYAAWSPGEAFARLFAGSPEEVLRGSRLGALVKPTRGPAGAEDFAATLAAAAALREGRWSFFGREVKLDDPPAWRRDPLTGGEWPDLPSRKLDYRRADLAGGAKFVWEPGRLTFLPTLALAWRITGDDAYAAQALRWLEDFAARNPLGHGIHHTSGIEMAVRVLTVSHALALLGERAHAAPLAPSLGLLAQQALHCGDHLSLGSSANNHLIAEYAALATVGALFPTLRGGPALLERGLAGLHHETLRQFHADGVSAEQAFGYLPFVWELLLCAFVAAEAAGQAVSPAVRERLRASLEFARAIRLPGGRWPQVGDEDDGRILLEAEAPGRLDLVGNALAAWLGADGLAEDGEALARLVVGRVAPARAAADRCHQFPAGGYTVWREHGLAVTWDHGGLGLGPLAAHGHADALSVTIFRDEDPVVVDPGTFAYHEEPDARERFRSSPYHATVSFGGRSQVEALGPFLWGHRFQLVKRDEGYECQWPSGERHWRRVELVGEAVRLLDRLEGEDAELVFPLHPSARVELAEGRARVTVGTTHAVFEAAGIKRWRVEPGEYSPRFAQRQDAKRLVASAAGEECSTVIRLGPAR